MILVDTSVWIDHLRASDPTLVDLLGRDEVGCHPFVIEELALGSVRHRDEMLGLLASLRQFPVVEHADVMTLVQKAMLWSTGLSAVDVHLLGSVLIVPDATLWTRDRRLAAAGRERGALYVGGT